MNTLETETNMANEWMNLVMQMKNKHKCSLKEAMKHAKESICEAQALTLVVAVKRNELFLHFYALMHILLL